MSSEEDCLTLQILLYKLSDLTFCTKKSAYEPRRARDVLLLAEAESVDRVFFAALVQTTPCH